MSDHLQRCSKIDAALREGCELVVGAQRLRIVEI